MAMAVTSGKPVGTDGGPYPAYDPASNGSADQKSGNLGDGIKRLRDGAMSSR
ncbi:MAG TPA: hypothetical protein VFU71_15165 [Burkholderiaceae bacterium]|nr:hypothetical protein [Burkholderiaceae bacterium]